MSIRLGISGWLRYAHGKMGTHPTDVEKQTLQICKLGRSNTEQPCSLVIHGASDLLVGSEGIYAKSFNSRTLWED
jgi:hypothetical protein